MEPGKVPMELLARLLGRVTVRDPRVLLGPRVGCDAAVLDFGDRLLVAKVDPITFATDLIGWYAVQVNANDIACLGATPRWFLSTVFLPEGAPESLMEEIFDQMLSACQVLNVTLVGGHSEVTYRLQRPMVAGTLLGEVARDRIVWPGGARPGDVLLLTKGIAIEGTALLAREVGDALQSRGVDKAVVDRARELIFTPGISVVTEALAGSRSSKVHAMHDPTEGGLATGLLELALAANVGLEVDAEAIPVLPETETVCRALGLDPMGLLASGALLLAVAPGDVGTVRAALEQQHISVHQIGQATPKERGLRMRTRKGEQPLPTFARDELARYFSAAHQTAS